MEEVGAKSKGQASSLAVIAILISPLFAIEESELLVSVKTLPAHLFSAGKISIISLVSPELDKIKIQNTSQRTLERAKDGQVMSWNNPNSGNSGTVTPTRTVVENNTYCREYQQTVTIDGKTQNAYGKACRQTDGSWNIKS